MYSRAHLIIERDWDQLKKDTPWGIEAHPLKEDNIFEWSAKILGPKGSPWEGGIFRLYIKFDEHYNSRPPQVCFHTIPFHPNVDMITGKPTIDFLDDWSCWKEEYTMTHVLQKIQLLLSEPLLDDAVNIEAVDMLLYSPHSYKQMVLDCVEASQRVEAGLSPHLDGGGKVRFAPQANELPPPPPVKSIPQFKSNISFEDYHLTWSGIATSKALPEHNNPYQESLKNKPHLQITHYGAEMEELEDRMEKQVEEHNMLVYGRIQNKPTNEELKRANIERISMMKKIYLHPGTPRKTPTIPLNDEMIRQATLMKDEWEDEVDDLVAWTTQLDENNIE